MDYRKLNAKNFITTTVPRFNFPKLLLLATTTSARTGLKVPLAPPVPILYRRGQYSEVLQRALNCFVNGSIFIAAVPVGRTQRLEFAQVAVEVLLADLLRRRAPTRKPYVLQEGDHVVAERFVVLVQVVVPLGDHLVFLLVKRDQCLKYCETKHMM